MAALVDPAARIRDDRAGAAVTDRVGAACGIASGVRCVGGGDPELPGRSRRRSGRERGTHGGRDDGGGGPRWVCLLALTAATVMIVEVVEDLASTGTNLGPLGIIGFGLANVWIVSVAITAWRHRPAPETDR